MKKIALLAAGAAMVTAGCTLVTPQSPHLSDEQVEATREILAQSSMRIASEEVSECNWLTRLTGGDSVSLNPNAGNACNGPDTSGITFTFEGNLKDPEAALKGLAESLPASVGGTTVAIDTVNPRDWLGTGFRDGIGFYAIDGTVSYPTGDEATLLCLAGNPGEQVGLDAAAVPNTVTCRVELLE